MGLRQVEAGGADGQSEVDGGGQGEEKCEGSQAAAWARLGGRRGGRRRLM